MNLFHFIIHYCGKFRIKQIIIREAFNQPFPLCCYVQLIFFHIHITSFDDLSSIVTSHNVGDKLKFTVIRDGDKKDITLELEEKKAETKES